MFLSVIIPVYNAESYLDACLASLLEQDIPREDYEILCVNDGSTDGSLSILARAASENPNVRILSQENQGVAQARNAGLEEASGEYIWFVDGDDLVRENCLARLKRAAEETGCDRLNLGAYQFTGTLSREERQSPLPDNAPWYDSVVWRALLRRGFLQENGISFRYPELTHGEDGLFMYELSLHAPKTAQAEETCYFYRVHAQSAENARTIETHRKKARSHMAIAEILRGYYVSGNADERTADKLMSCLWTALYEIAQLPGPEARAALTRLKQAGLFPFAVPPECTLKRSYLTARGNRLLDWLCRHLQTRWGYAAIRVLHQLKRLLR